MFALEINGDGSVTFVATVAGSGRTWSFAEFQRLLVGFKGNEAAVGLLYPVSGWISGAQFSPRCGPEASHPDPLWGCGAESWLTPTAVWPNQVSPGSWGFSSPAGSIRLANGAWPPYGGLAGVDASGSANPVLGVFLLAPVAPTPDACIECSNGAAVLIAGLDPPVSTDQLSVHAPAPSPSLDPTSAAAEQTAREFETARATGDFETAWSYLGPATRAVFGNEQTFAAQEAAYNATGAAVFKIAAPSRDPDLLDPSNIGNAASDYVASTAWYVGINHPNVDGASAGFEGLVVAQGIDGEWHVWIVH